MTLIHACPVGRYWINSEVQMQKMTTRSRAVLLTGFGASFTPESSSAAAPKGWKGTIPGLSEGGSTTVVSIVANVTQCAEASWCKSTWCGLSCSPMLTPYGSPRNEPQSIDSLPRHTGRTWGFACSHEHERGWPTLSDLSVCHSHPSVPVFFYLLPVCQDSSRHLKQ